MSLSSVSRTGFGRSLALSIATSALVLSGPAPVHAEAKGAVVIAMPYLSQQFDPTAMVGALPHTVYDFIFDGLINLGPKGKYPALAESWDISKDGKQIDFKLRKDVKFHNGDPFTAEDVKFTFEKVMAPDSGHGYRKGFLESIGHIEVVSPLVARFVLKQPWPAFFTTLRYGLTPIAPKNYYQKVGAKGFQENPIGTGPYKLAGIKAGEWTKFEATDNYWAGAPNVKIATLLLVREPFTRYAMLERGEADIVAGLTGPLLERIRSNPDIKVYTARHSGTSGIMFNKDLFPEAADRRVRLAVGYAINRKQIAEKLLGGVCQPATSMFTPGTFGYLDGLAQIPYDPGRAKALLKEAGIKSGHKITFVVQNESFAALPNAPQVLEAIAGNLEAVGFTVERKSMDNAAWIAMMRGHKPTGIFYTPISIPDDGGEVMNSYFVSWSGWTARSVKLPEYDDIFKRQIQMTNLDERTKVLQTFAKLESHNLENIPLLWCDTPFAVSTKRVRKWEPQPGSGHHLRIKDLELVK